MVDFKESILEMCNKRIIIFCIVGLLACLIIHKPDNNQNNNNSNQDSTSYTQSTVVDTTKNTSESTDEEIEYSKFKKYNRRLNDEGTVYFAKVAGKFSARGCAYLTGPIFILQAFLLLLKRFGIISTDDTDKEKSEDELFEEYIEVYLTDDDKSKKQTKKYSENTNICISTIIILFLLGIIIIAISSFLLKRIDLMP